MGHTVFGAERHKIKDVQLFDVEGPAQRDPKRLAVFAFARKLSRTPEAVERADVDSLRPHLSDTQIVELAFAVCRYNTMNRLAEVFGAPLERANLWTPRPGAMRPSAKPKPASAPKPPSSSVSA